LKSDFREARFYEQSKSSGDYRIAFEKDYDRILYSSAFRRLARVTQVVNASEEPVFHNRLTHSLKVSQIGRRLSQHLLSKYKANKKEIDKLGGLDPEVVAAAGLAHDLGNPPFGHAAETTLDQLIKDEGIEEGFEGNAQSFRIVNFISCSYSKFYGLNLTRATLNAILKYPWLCDTSTSEKSKYGVYKSEESVFKWVRQQFPLPEKQKSIEASIMDLSDDITYAIHDLEDFVRADIIPFYALSNGLSVKNLIKTLLGTKEQWAPSWDSSSEEIIKGKVSNFFSWAADVFPFNGPYSGEREEKVILKQFSSVLITRFIENTELTFSKDGPLIVIASPACDELQILKALTKSYVIHKNSLIREQHGESNIIEGLFNTFLKSVDSPEKLSILPPTTKSLITSLKTTGKLSKYVKLRLIADAISNMTDNEAILTYSKLLGVQPGSIFDRPI